MEKMCHIPHSSIYIPKEYINNYILSPEELEKEALTMCDIRTDEMTNGCITFPYSRIFCDVERINSDKEIMNSVGMGVLYTKTHNLKPLRDNPAKEIIKLYNEHHNKLNKILKEKLENHNEVLFIDLHSYSNKPLEYELNKNLKRPDICIGINKRFNKIIINKLIYIIENFNYSLVVNEPFSGCLLPSDYIDDERVHGFMIDINKKLYDTDLKFEKIKSFLKCVNKI